MLSGVRKWILQTFVWELWPGVNFTHDAEKDKLISSPHLSVDGWAMSKSLMLIFLAILISIF